MGNIYLHRTIPCPIIITWANKCFVVFCLDQIVTHILQGCFTCIGAIIWLPQCQWCNPEGYGQISQMSPQRLVNTTTTKQSKTKAFAYFMEYTTYIPRYYPHPILAVKPETGGNCLTLSDDNQTLGHVERWFPEQVWISEKWRIKYIPHIMHMVHSLGTDVFDPNLSGLWQWPNAREATLNVG